MVTFCLGTTVIYKPKPEFGWNDLHLQGIIIEMGKELVTVRFGKGEDAKIRLEELE